MAAFACDDALMANEREELVATLEKHRGFLKYAVQGLTDEQAGKQTTVSELCLGGLVKHVAAVEDQWVRFVNDGPAAFAPMSAESYEEHANTFRMLPGETVASILEHYDEVSSATTDLIRNLTSLDIDHPLPEAPWFEQGARWSARRVFLHILAETAQHAGHADILREAIDGQKTMG